MSTLPRLEHSAAYAVVGLAVLETINLYRDAAPSLSDIRCSDPHDYTMRQLILDADFLGGLAALLIGGSSALLTRTLFPVVLASSGVLLLSLYYRSVLNSKSPMPEGMNESE